MPFPPDGPADEAEGADPVAETLRALAQELGDLARLGDRLQGPISEALLAAGAADGARMKEFQAIDLLVQRLHGVCVFLDALSELAPPSWRLDCGPALDKVPLTDLARRLARIHHGGVHGGADLEGDLELFG
jgi:hypothetical protein